MKRVAIVLPRCLISNRKLCQKFSGLSAEVCGGEDCCASAGDATAAGASGLGKAAGSRSKDTHYDGTSPLAILTSGLLFAVAAGEATREVDDLGKWSENLNLRNVRSLRFFGEQFHIGTQKTRGGLVVALAQDIGVMQRGGS